MHPIVLPDREPLKIGGNAALYTTGISAFSATMLALYVRDVEGYGQHVDVSAMETITVAQIHASIQQQFGRIPGRRASTLVPARDGWVHPGLERGIRADTWVRFCMLMGKPELTDDPKFATPEARREHQQELLALISAWTATRPKEELYHTLHGAVAGAAILPDAGPSLRRAGPVPRRGLYHPWNGMAARPSATTGRAQRGDLR
jgi:crotonobetainyl-CoA:carnitine CoA-transferase CaiB-like acyl-CoA transferase